MLSKARKLINKVWTDLIDRLPRNAPAADRLDTLALPAALVAALFVVLLGLLDWTLGTDSKSATSAWHLIAVALQGVACSLLASAAYACFVENRLAVERQHQREDFFRLFGLPETDSTAKCIIAVPSRNDFPILVQDIEGRSCVQSVKYDSRFHAEEDIACASELQAMITAILGRAPQWSTPEEAINIAKTSTEPTIIFSIGLWSNNLSLEICSTEETVLQRLLRLPIDPCCKIRVAIPTPTGEYNVDSGEGYAETAVPPGTESGKAVVLRARGPASGATSCVVVGGFTGNGTKRIGSYLRNNWQQFPTERDSAGSARCVSGSQYVIEFDTYPSGVVAKEVVMVGNVL
jgi:hypothetical protein